MGTAIGSTPLVQCSVSQVKTIPARNAFAAAIGGMLAALLVPILILTRFDIPTWIFLASVFTASILSAGAAWYAGNRLTREIDRVSSASRMAADGELGVAAPPSSLREVSDLGRATNRLIGKLTSIELQYAQEQRWIEAIFDGLQDGVLLVDGNEQVISANGRAAELLGLTGLEPTGQRLIVIARDHELVDQFRSVMRTGEREQRTVHLTLSDRFIEIAVVPVAAEGERLGLIVLRDVTSLRRLELVRREFVANVSHELKTPLASIRALADTLDAGAIDDPKVASDFLGRIALEVDRLNVLVDELLDLGRLESGRLALEYRAVLPGELIHRAVERLRHQIESAGLSMEIELAPGMAAATLDVERVEQVLINLIQNAIKYTPSGGSLTVRASESEGWLRIEVADTGVGIHADELPRLFERFYKSDRARRSSDTGLGLAIAKHIVLAHGGRIGVESTLGHGSVFVVDLPIDPPKRVANSTSAAP